MTLESDRFSSRAKYDDECACDFVPSVVVKQSQLWAKSDFAIRLLNVERKRMLGFQDCGSECVTGVSASHIRTCTFRIAEWTHSNATRFHSLIIFARVRNVSRKINDNKSSSLTFFMGALCFYWNNKGGPELVEQCTVVWTDRSE